MSVTNKLVRMEEHGGKNCVAVNEALTLIRDKWTILVIGVLGRHESLRYNELQRPAHRVTKR